MMEQPKKHGTLALACTTVLFLPCMLLAKIAAAQCINIVTIKDDTVSKRRLCYAGLLRIPGNLILGFRRAPVKVLSTKQWQERERRLANASVSDRAVVLKRIDGVTLSDYLAQESTVDRKLAAINAALGSLFDFHLQHDQSHGDATATNVMIHESSDGELSATWFDFDVAHKESVSSIIRRADDLRALFFTAKPWLSDEDFARLFTGTESPYTDDDVWRELIKTMGNPFQHCDIFHMAQQQRATRSLPNGEAV